MDPLYQRTFDQVRMSEEGTRRVRAQLASRCAQKELEESTMRSNEKTRRPLAAIAAVCAVLALSVTALASSGLAERVFHMFTGDTITVTENEDGSVSADFDGETPASPVETRDGRLWFIANGEEIDITDQVSSETPYLHECLDADGQRHLFIIGGEPDAIGWAECMVDAGGAMSAFVLSLSPEAEDQPTPWLDAALAQMGAQVQVAE